MSTRKVLILASMVALFVAPAVFAAQPVSDNAYAVLGEKQDSGLGELPASYTASEFPAQVAIAGEKLDSGLGNLPADYTGAEFLKTAQAQYRVIGESLDNGLGNLPASYTAVEFQKQLLAQR